MDHVRISYFCCFLAAALLVGDAVENVHFKHLARREHKDSCDLFVGDWIVDPSDPRYSENCQFIRDYQNCLKNGRPDKAYLHWRWKPRGCELPLLDPKRFLTFMTNKVFAFVGDSVVRNQKESLLCLLSKVEEPSLLPNDEQAWFFPSYNFTVVTRPSLFLLRMRMIKLRVFELHLDALDPRWTDSYHTFDYVVFSGGPWFDHETFLLENNTVVGCHRCEMEDVPELGQYYAYRKALNLTFRFVIASEHKPLVIYRIHAPNHFERGLKHVGGNCNKTIPFKEGESMSNFKEDQLDKEYERIGREEYAAAIATTKIDGARLEMLDIYHLSLLRPDAHPNTYRGIESGNKSDCLHWCTPGAIDTWNDLMMEMTMGNKRMKSSS